MPEGLVFCGNGPIDKIAKDLRAIAAFLQSLVWFESDRLIRYDDWWEHDGLHFKKGRTDLHELFVLLKTSRSLLESMPGDDHVFIGLGPEDESWYLRFYADWDCNDDTIVAAYAIALKENLVGQFKEEALPKLVCCSQELDSGSYFKRICDGKCSI